MRTAHTHTHARAQEAEALLAAFKADGGAAVRGRLGAGADDALWAAKRLRDGATNPGTGERIPAPVRMAGFIPVNIPLVAGMLNATSVPGTLFWQWANQSYNSATNYSNRSGSDMTMEQIGTSYGIAVGASCGLALAFRWLGKHGPPSFRRVAAVPFVVPYIAVSAAGASNVYFSRRPEMDNGVVVRDEAGEELGVSREAGKQGVYRTILSRSLGLPIPVLVLPAIAMALVPKSVPPRARMLVELGAITSSLCFALPATLAIFPQRMALDARSLEPQFHNLRNADGKPITTVFSNKGL